jgi:hypothetical protein
VDISDYRVGSIDIVFSDVFPNLVEVSEWSRVAKRRDTYCST